MLTKTQTKQIETLRSEAAVAGDLLLVATCDVALYGECAAQDGLTTRELHSLPATRDEAIEIISDVLAGSAQ